jgi:hypothetical protein
VELGAAADLQAAVDFVLPLALLILAVLGSIVVGLATPAEAAAVGAFGGFILAAIYRFISHCAPGDHRRIHRNHPRAHVREFGTIIKESSFLTAKTSAMVCWLFVGSGIFSAAFALLGGQELIEKWVLSLNMTPLQFMILRRSSSSSSAGRSSGPRSSSSSCRSSSRCSPTSSRPAVLRPAGGAEPADRVPVAAGGDGRVLSERRIAARMSR